MNRNEPTAGNRDGVQNLLQALESRVDGAVLFPLSSVSFLLSVLKILYLYTDWVI